MNKKPDSNDNNKAAIPVGRRTLHARTMKEPGPHFREVAEQMEPFPDELPRGHEVTLRFDLTSVTDSEEAPTSIRTRDNLDALRAFVGRITGQLVPHNLRRASEPDVALFYGLRQFEAALNHTHNFMAEGFVPARIFPIPCEVSLGYLARRDVNVGFQDIEAIRQRVDQILKRPIPAGVPAYARQGIQHFKQAIRESWLPQLAEIEQRELDLYETLEDQLPRDDARAAESWLETISKPTSGMPGNKR